MPVAGVEGGGGGGFDICAQDVGMIIQRPEWVDSMETADEYISVVGSAVSVCCYFAIILTFPCFSHLLNIPCLCALNLCTCLLLDDVLFLLSFIMKYYTPHPSLCKCVGVVMHFTLISAYVWGVVMAVDILLTFTRRIPYERNKRKTLSHYCAMVLTASAFIVVPSVVVGETSILDVSYNKNRSCMLQGHTGRLIFYFVPVIVSFVISAGILSFSLYKISHEDHENKVALAGGGGGGRERGGGHTGDTNCCRSLHLRRVSLKLIVVCGLTELIGVIYIYKEHPSRNEQIVNAILSLLYSAVRSFRGVMLFLVYVIGRKDVKKLYRNNVARFVRSIQFFPHKLKSAERIA